jgi:hypothetical protein
MQRAPSDDSTFDIVMTQAEAVDLVGSLSAVDGKLAGLQAVYKQVIGEDTADITELRGEIQKGILILSQQLGGAPMELGEPDPT